MLHYVTTNDGSPCLWREPEDIQEEIEALHLTLREQRDRMQRAEEAKEALLLSLSEQEDYRDGEKVRLLSDLCEECEETRHELQLLRDRMDALSEELDEALWWMKGFQTA